MNKFDTKAFYHLISCGLMVSPYRNVADELSDYAYVLKYDNVKYVIDDLGELDEDNDSYLINTIIHNTRQFIEKKHNNDYHEVIKSVIQNCKKFSTEEFFVFVQAADDNTIAVLLFNSDEEMVANIIFSSDEKSMTIEDFVDDEDESMPDELREMLDELTSEYGDSAGIEIRMTSISSPGEYLLLVNSPEFNMYFEHYNHDSISEILFFPDMDDFDFDDDEE